MFLSFAILSFFLLPLNFKREPQQTSVEPSYLSPPLSGQSGALPHADHSPSSTLRTSHPPASRHSTPAAGPHPSPSSSRSSRTPIPVPQKQSLRNSVVSLHPTTPTKEALPQTLSGSPRQESPLNFNLPLNFPSSDLPLSLSSECLQSCAAGAPSLPSTVSSSSSSSSASCLHPGQTHQTHSPANASGNSSKSRRGH